MDVMNFETGETYEAAHSTFQGNQLSLSNAMSPCLNAFCSGEGGSGCFLCENLKWAYL